MDDEHLFILWVNGCRSRPMNMGERCLHLFIDGCSMKYSMDVQLLDEYYHMLWMSRVVATWMAVLVDACMYGCVE